MQARLIRSVRQNKKDERSAINVVFCPFGYFSTTMCPKLRKCTRYRTVALARDRAKVKKGGYRRKSGSHRLARDRAKVKKGGYRTKSGSYRKCTRRSLHA